MAKRSFVSFSAVAENPEVDQLSDVNIPMVYRIGLAERLIIELEMWFADNHENTELEGVYARYAFRRTHLYTMRELLIWRRNLELERIFI